MNEFLTPTELLNDREATSAIAKNPFVTYIKFILTDDKPNFNKQRVPKEEFQNLISSGIFMPIKMAAGKINDTHDKAIPLGVITQLMESGDQILGQAAIWNKERPEDIELIRKTYTEGKPLNLSWEIDFAGTKKDETTGIVDLIDTTLRAATLVGLPAYAGRTQILAVASKQKIDNVIKIISELEISDDVKSKIQAELNEISNENMEVNMEEANSAVWTKAYEDKLPDSCFLYIEPGGTKDSEGKTEPRSLRHFPYKNDSGKVDLPHVKDAIGRIPQSKISESLKQGLQDRARKIYQANSSTEEDKLEELEQLKQQVAANETKIQELTTALAAKDEELKTLNTETASLREFKKVTEEAVANAQKLEDIKQKFASAGLKKDEEYFKTHKDTLLALNENQLNYMIQELVSAFASASIDPEKRKALVLPNFPAGDQSIDYTDPKVLAREYKKQKKESQK